MSYRMAVAVDSESAFRVERAENSRLAWAFAFSLILHLVVFGGYRAGNQLGWWQRLELPSWMKPTKMLADLAKRHEPPPPQQPEEVPLVFVEVSPAQATPEPPKEAKFYSDKNSIAANPEPDKNTAEPKITGEQTEIVKTEDVPREKLSPLPPPPVPPTPPAKEKQDEAKAAPSQKPGDLAMATPSDLAKKDDGQEKKERKKMTVEEAKALLAMNQLPGEKMKQDGGVERRQQVSLDTKATPFGAYDNALVQAIANMWYHKLDERMYASDYRGKVVIQFDLHFDGSVTGLGITENTAGPVPGLICETAVDEPRPYQPFSSEMRRVLGDTRHIQFTFYYN